MVWQIQLQNALSMRKVCTYAVKPRNYEVFARTAKKRTFLTIFGGVVTIATADTPKLELRVCVKVKCESFETCEKCAQNVWGAQMCKNTNF